MRLPSVVEGELSDFEWSRVESVPATPAPQTVQPPTRIEDIPSPVAAGTITADEFVKRYDAYWDAVLKLPNWEEQVIARSAAAKEARRVARKLKRGKPQ